MGRLVLYYATMNSGKSLNLIKTDYNYREIGLKTLVMKPEIDTKSNEYISSRVGLKREVDYLIGKDDSILDILSNNLDDVYSIFIDEAQFLNKKQVYELRLLTAATDIRVVCYALRVNFKGELFEGSKYLLNHADEIHELRTLCKMCDKESVARYVGRRVDGVFVKDGDEVLIDGSLKNVEYIPLCEEHFLELIKNENMYKVRRRVYGR